MASNSRAVKNVVVFSIRDKIYAMELGWIREIFVLPHVTPIPMSPSPLVGAVNFRGAILPVLDVEALLTSVSCPLAQKGEPAILIEVERNLIAVRAGKVDEVSSLEVHGDELIDRENRAATLLDPYDLFFQARQLQNVLGSEGA